MWNQARVDDDPKPRDLKITIRTWLHDGHPLEIYINGGHPLYPTVVYDINDNIMGVSAGLLGTVKDK